MWKKIDRQLLIITLVLVIAGFFIFMSAALGLLARSGASLSSVAFNQLVFGLGLGVLALFATTSIHYRFWKKYALYIFLFTLAVTLLVFIPGLGLSFGGATRWLQLGPLPSFQPTEILKLGFVIYFAAWLSANRDHVKTFSFGTIPFLVLLSIVGGVVLAQPDTGTFMVIAAAGIAMYIAAGARWRHIFSLGGIMLAGLATLAFLRPYVKDRIMTFLDPSNDPMGVSYQIQQSLIAIGSGGWFGRGFGQSIQKFNFLPEPIGDSIFSVAAEEFGFIGALLLITLFILFAIRGLKIASRTPDQFGGLLAVGIVILIVSQSFINIASMLGVLPLTGVPLLFISHGGTALFLALAEVGIILNISRYQKV